LRSMASRHDPNYSPSREAAPRRPGRRCGPRSHPLERGSREALRQHPARGRLAPRRACDGNDLPDRSPRDAPVAAQRPGPAVQPLHLPVAGLQVQRPAAGSNQLPSALQGARRQAGGLQGCRRLTAASEASHLTRQHPSEKVGEGARSDGLRRVWQPLQLRALLWRLGLLDAALQFRQQPRRRALVSSPSGC